MRHFLKNLFDSRKKPVKFIDLSGIPLSDESYNRIRNEQEAYAMRLLDKINRSGKDSLTKDERAFLQAFSQKQSASR